MIWQSTDLNLQNVYIRLDLKALKAQVLNNVVLFPAFWATGPKPKLYGKTYTADNDQYNRQTLFPLN